MTSPDEPERRLAEALRARASDAGRDGVVPRSAPRAHPRPAMSVGIALLIALLGGAVLGTVLALVSLLAPGVLPPLG